MDLEDPLPLPAYTFDASLSEDENFLTWASILARHSYSRKGHMGAIVVRPPPDGMDPSSIQQGVFSPPSDPDTIPPSARVLTYANNVPLLFHRSPKNVPEIHAEALCIARAARSAIALAGTTAYVTYPPCNECFKLLAASGVQRCVFKKNFQPGTNDAVLVAARVLGVELIGTGPQRHFSSDVEIEEDTKNNGIELDSNLKQRHDTRDTNAQNGFNVEPSKQASQRHFNELLASEKRADLARDARVRKFWDDQGETGKKTRDRVNQWWNNWIARYRDAEQRVYADFSIRKRSNAPIETTTPVGSASYLRCPTLSDENLSGDVHTSTASHSIYNTPVHVDPLGDQDILAHHDSSYSSTPSVPVKRPPSSHEQRNGS